MVPDSGFPNARLVLIGEAPAREEVKQGRPFVGPSGQLLEKWWSRVGLRRDLFYITNVHRERCDGDDIGTLTAAELSASVTALHERLAALADPWVIIPTGNTALQAVTGRTGITKWRGSPLTYHDMRGREIKVIPTIHPAAAMPFRNPEYERRCSHDWARIATDMLFRDTRVPERHVLAAWTEADADNFVKKLMSCELMSVDIETNIKTADLLCVGFAASARTAYVFPAHFTDHIRTLCASSIPKIAQYGLFDAFHLAWNQMPLANVLWDTHAQHHCLDAADEHTLEYMASVDTRQPYWKDLHKGKKAREAFGSNSKALYHYNGLDACVTYELAVTYFERLKASGKLGFYAKHYRAMFQPLLDMMLHGFRVDEVGRNLKYNALRAEYDAHLAALATLAGESLIAEKDFSKLKLEKFLYTTLGMPKQTRIRKGERKLSADETAIRKLLEKYPDRFGVAGNHILEARRKAKLSTFYGEGIADQDGYVRCQYRYTTTTGRLSSAKNPRGTGMNLQNVDREARDVFMADPGHILLTLDYSQIESRIVGILTGDAELIEMASRMPWEWDEHTFIASIVLGKPAEEVTTKPNGGERYYAGKKPNHASNYGLMGKLLSELLAKEGILVTADEAQHYIDTVMERFPAKRQWQRRIQDEVMAKKKLVTPIFGRELDFTWALTRPAMTSGEVFRAAFAFKPQAIAADMTNQFGVIAAHTFLTESGLSAQGKAHLIAQVHDSVMFSVDPEVAWQVYRAVKASMERPLGLEGVPLRVPVGVTVGESWGNGVEFKRPPEEGAFMAKVEEALWQTNVAAD